MYSRHVSQHCSLAAFERYTRNAFKPIHRKQKAEDVTPLTQKLHDMKLDLYLFGLFISCQVLELDQIISSSPEDFISSNELAGNNADGNAF